MEPNTKFIAELHDTHIGDTQFYSGHSHFDDDALIACVDAITTFDNSTKTVDLLKDLKTQFQGSNITPFNISETELQTNVSEIYKAIDELFDDLISTTPKNEKYAKAQKMTISEPLELLAFVHIYKA